MSSLPLNLSLGETIHIPCALHQSSLTQYAKHQKNPQVTLITITSLLK